MLKKAVYGLMAAMLFASGIALAENSPSIDQVYKAAESGNLNEAQRMMDVVLAQHPNSAKAHFVEAEIAAKQGQMERASSELGKAEELKPGLPFAKPEAVQELKSRIGGRRSGAMSVAQPASSGFPWGMLFVAGGAIAILFLIMRAISARNAVSSYQPAQRYGQPQGYGNQPYAPQPYGQPYGGAAPMSGGMGSTIMGGLATGAAVGAGMVAGEALAHHFMDGSSSGSSSGNNINPVADSWTDSPDNMGGTDFGIADNSSWDDSSNFADSGDSDWG